MNMDIKSVIRKKREKKELTRDEIRYFVGKLMKQEIIARSNKFEEETRGTKDQYNHYREHVQYVYKYAVMIAKEKNVDLEIKNDNKLIISTQNNDKFIIKDKQYFPLFFNENYIPSNPGGQTDQFIKV